MGICTNCLSVNKTIDIAKRWTCSNVNNKKLDNVTGLYYEPFCYCVNGDGKCNYYSDGNIYATYPDITAQKSILTGKASDTFILSCYVDNPETYETQTYQWYKRVYDDNGITYIDTEVESADSKILELSSLTAGTYFYYMKAINTYVTDIKPSDSDLIKVIVSAS